MMIRYQNWVLLILVFYVAVANWGLVPACKGNNLASPNILQRSHTAPRGIGSVEQLSKLRGGYTSGEKSFSRQHAAPKHPSEDGGQLQLAVEGGGLGGSSVHHVENPEGEMSVSTAIMNIVADLCPHGMLPVAYGMAAAGGTGLAVAPLLLGGFGLISCYTMVSLGRACQRTKQWSFGGLWGDLVGKDSAWVLEVAVAVMCFGCCVFYSTFVGDLFAAMASSVSFMPAFLKKRWVDLVGLTLFPLLPLCLMNNLSALQYTSFFGLTSIFYTVSFVILRSLDGTYAEGGIFYEAIDARYRSPVANPWSTVGLWRVGPGFITLMNVACVAFMAHYNGVKYFEELKDRTVGKYATTVGTAMLVSLGVFSLMMLFGFRTFGGAAQALILNNYHKTDDPLAGLARLATGFSILCGYPLMFAALKSSFFNAASMLWAKVEKGEGRALDKQKQAYSQRLLMDQGLRTSWVLAILGLVTLIACNQSEEDVAIIVGLIGALLGSSANYIIPAILNLKLLRREGAKHGVFSEMSLNKVIIVFGAIFMALGTTVTLNEAGSHGEDS